MAVVKLGNKVKTNLPDTIRYVINPEKNDGAGSYTRATAVSGMTRTRSPNR
ncbi:hypothetical protein [uncultured Bifidobacterium sp.]|uniref:hypothetical protein n=1 Tax=uncultured Bifidobacterium sp. TaxID=165187 RepID=UPI0027DC8BFF|nr:hypothetical protein [uncultured Bifidobacterium sp.]